MKEFTYSDEEIFKKIDEIYKDEKGKKFITHLLRSFFPVNKTEYLWSPPKDASLLKCCITGHPLISKDEVMKIELGMGEEKLKLVSKVIIEEMNSEGNKKEYREKLDRLLKDKYKGRLLAVTTPESNKYLALPVQGALFNWMATRVIKGDKYISWLMKSIRKNEVLKYAQENKIKISEKEKSTFNKVVNKPHKLSLMDNQVLKELSEKLKKTK